MEAGVAARRDEVQEREDVCAASVGISGNARAGVAPFSRASGTCSQGAFCDWVDAPPDAGDLCFVANTNIARAERDARAAGALHAASTGAGALPPKFLDRVEGHLHLRQREADLLRRNGFVVLERESRPSYALAFHEIFQSQLPVYVGVDAIFNAVFQASQTLLGDVERTRLGPKLAGLVDRMRRALARSRTAYDAATFEDLDLYLTVARRLLRSERAPSLAAARNDVMVDALVERATGGGGLEAVFLFGRERMIDFSQFTPRGHYATGGWPVGIELGGGDRIGLDAYFRAMMWLSRIEFNVVSRGCRSSHPGPTPDPTETPREARDALALADLASRAGVLDDVRAFDEVYGVFAGRREDISVSEMLAVMRSANLTPRDLEAPAKLRSSIGDKFRRSARVHFMPEGSGELPAIATMFGPRITPEIAPLTALVHDAVPDRVRMTAADLAYVLGHDRARAYLERDLTTHPSLGGALRASRDEAERSMKGRNDVYSTWLGAVRRLADKEAGTQPTFMKTEAYADMRLGSALAAYAQIRHTFVLLAGQGYDSYGCEIPDGWVEPAVGVYEAILGWARAARTAVPSKASYFRRVEHVVGMLRDISRTELSGSRLSEPQRRWLAMIAEMTPRDGWGGGDSGEPPKYTGWYFDLFPDREIGALRDVGLVADWFTLTNVGEVRYLGIETTALGVFSIDTPGEPRLMVGPVAKTYELATPIDVRLDDESARSAQGKTSAWSRYAVDAPAEPPLRADLYRCDGDARLALRGADDLGAVTVTLLDHHGDPLGDSITRDVGREPVVFGFRLPKAVLEAPHGIEGVHLHVHDLATSRSGRDRFDSTTPVMAWDLEPGPRPVPARRPAPIWTLALGTMRDVTSSGSASP